MVDQPTIERAGRLLAQAAGKGARVYLFGSHARGEANESSDLDFVVIEPEVEDRHAEMVQLRRALNSPEIPVMPIDVLVYSEEDVRTWGHVRGTAVNAALREGRLLHE